MVLKIVSKPLLKPYELPRSLQGPHEEIAHSFVIAEDAQVSSNTGTHTYATCVLPGV